MPVGFEDGVVPVHPGNPDWNVGQFPPERWGVDSLNPISGDFSLHHCFDNPEAGCDYFMIHHGPFRRSQAEDSIIRGDSLSFSFRVRHSYPPSSGNNWQLAILAGFDVAIKEGIVIGVNLEGSDDLIKLWRARDGVYEELCSSAFNYQEEAGTEAAPLFRLTWQWDGVVELWYAVDPMDEMKKIASCSLQDLPEGRSLVARYEYSAAQDRNLWFDDLHLEGSFEADTVSPQVSTWWFENGTTLKLSFSEPVLLSDSSRVLLYRLSQAGLQLGNQAVVPDTFFLEENTLCVIFPTPVPNREQLDLLLEGICDRDGNFLSASMLRIVRNEAVWGDVVINEVMADPDPEVLISLGEYVELYNRSEYQLNLEGWTLEVGGRKYELGSGEKEKMLERGEYLLLSPVILPNQGSLLALYNRAGEQVHAASYRIPYNASQWKEKGGWSLESPDPDRLCNVSQLWEYSLDRSGGTPGGLNSVDGERPDEQVPVFLYFGYGDRGEIILCFSEPVNQAAGQEGKVILNPGNYQAQLVSGDGPLHERLICHFTVDPSLFSRFTITMPAVSDCEGNLSRELNFSGGPSSIPGHGSVIINEIMYDPAEGAVEYIELYNPTQQFIDLRELGLGVTGEEDPLDGMVALSEQSRIMVPGEYVVLTPGVDHLRETYGLEISGCWVELEDFESLPDGGGRIWLTDRSGNGIDVVTYGDHLHLELISDTRGISLERIDPGRPGSDPGNWHSAASVEGYATPGRLNSQSIHESDQKGRLVVEPGVFSPDNDGYNDLLVISPGVGEAGSVIRLWITRPDGTPVRSLANNHVAGLSSQYTWDGREDSGAMAAGGFYVVHLRVYHPSSGSRWNRKAAVGLIYR
ncbi:MAG: lamin tail domain-containing protein [Bacteroidetes bacterium]|nr:lamin tail domain-containing protein [Bacteroidota bacterium]